MLYNGEVSCQTLTGKISIVRLNTHNFHDDQELSEEEVCLYECGNKHVRMPTVKYVVGW